MLSEGEKKYSYDSFGRMVRAEVPVEHRSYHYVSDEQGSITHVLSEDAEILNHYSYDAFGNIIQKTEKVENRFCYNAAKPL